MTADRLLRSLFHCLLAVPIQLVAALLAQSAWAGAIAVVFYFYGREKVQHEYALKGAASTATVWHRGWWPGEWSRASRFDFILPAAQSVIAALAWGVL